MFKNIKMTLKHWFASIVLRGYGWRPRKTIYLGEPTQQWRNPFSLIWVTERIAMILLRDQLMDEYKRR